ncbi:hypothetical protein C5C23_01220 [Rathayibacter rathayi]|nr:hypothetical protein C5C02_00600 [Rathayibacter rathayi]PPG79062.1 hypothetical protein C5C23_01220 [Rathayibacter rathayi]
MSGGASPNQCRRRRRTDRSGQGANKGTRTAGPRTRRGKPVSGKSIRVLREEVPLAAKLELIRREERDPSRTLSIRGLCQTVGVNRSSYYEWRDRKTSATAEWRVGITELLRTAFHASDGTYGYRRVTAQLARWGRPVAHETVRRLMRAAGLEPCQPKPWRPVTPTPGDPTDIPDLVKRDFTAHRPGCKWVGDITSRNGGKEPAEPGRENDLPQ